MQRLGSACVLALTVAACGGKPPAPASDGAKPAATGQASPAPAGTAPAGMSSGLQQVAQGLQQATQNTMAVDYEALKAFLPEVAGWTRSDVKGEQVSAPVSYSRAQARYRHNDSRVELEITDTALSQLLLAPLSVFLASGYAERSDDGFKRAVQVGGQPGIEDWSAGAARGEVTAVVGNRFVVKATGHDVNAIDPVRKVVDAIDLSKLAATR